MRTRTRRLVRSGARLVVVNALVLIGLLLGAEALVRVAAPGVVPAGADEALFTYGANADGTSSYTLTPGASGDAYGASVRVTANGAWRYADADTTGPATLLIGDSVTMGLGVDPEQTFAGRLARGAHVANPSVLGWAAADYRRAVEARLSGARLGADSLRAVVVVWCLNDLYPEGQPIPIAAAQRASAEAPRASWRERAYQAVRLGAAAPLAWLGRHSRLYRWARTVPTDAQARTYAYDRSLYTEAAYQADRDRAFGQIRAIRDTLAARQIPLTVAVVPQAPQLRSAPPDTVPQDTVRARLARLGVAMLDLTPRLAESDFLTGDGTHLSPPGHARVAEALRPLVQN